MKIKDKKLKREVDVAGIECMDKKCYWPRPNPENYLQGRGYQSYDANRDNEYLCGTRNTQGCPDEAYNQKIGWL